MQIHQAVKVDKKAIKHFYKTNHYSASFMGDDQCFYIAVDNEIIACVIISYTTITPFLHALVVNENQQHKGLARQLVTHCQQLFTDLICFADVNLTEFYQKLGFTLINCNNIPGDLQNRFITYQRNNVNLCCFRREINA